MITTAVKKGLSFAKFLEYDFEDEGRYELVNGEIVKVQPTRKHDNIAEFISDLFKAEVKRLNLNYRVSGRILLRTFNKQGNEQGRFPDISVVDKIKWDRNLNAQSVWYEPLELAVEIVSNNWEDDYLDKLEEYQNLGIKEYWIVDYLALGSRNYLGNPKLPSTFVYVLDEKGIYHSKTYQNNDQIISPTFPQLKLTMNQILEA